MTLDIDSSESPVHGAQEQSAYNGHFESVCYHPLFVFNPGGYYLAAKLRPGNVHSADGWDDVLLPSLTGTARRGRPSSSARTRPARPLRGAGTPEGEARNPPPGQ